MLNDECVNFEGINLFRRRLCLISGERIYYNVDYQVDSLGLYIIVAPRSGCDC
jgi:hypothetical protein